MPVGKPSAMEGEDKRIVGLASYQPSFRLSGRHCFRGRWRLTERDPWASLLPLLEHTPTSTGTCRRNRVHVYHIHTEIYTMDALYLCIICACIYICNVSSIISILFMYSIFYLNIKKKFGLNFQLEESLCSIYLSSMSAPTWASSSFSAGCRKACRHLCQVLVSVFFHWLSVPHLYILESRLQAKVTREH